MNILIAKNGAQLGPFSENDLRAKLASGEFSPTDFAWHEGMPAWSPLSQVLGETGAPPAPPTPSPSMISQPSASSQSAVEQGQSGYAPQPYNSPFPQPYQQGVTPWGAPVLGSYAGFWLRFVAYIVDAIIIAIPTALICYPLLAASSASDVRTGSTLFRVVNLVLGWIYYAALESSRSQATLGKMILGLKVTDEGGNRIGFLLATGRYWGMLLSGFLLCIGFIMVAFTDRKQGLHDLMAHTLVVKK